ncbi:hypothetical protein H5J24_12545 [Chryseobacterium capnotolerans]|uniref:hypothetical protein n=1 Tax=Chryseobacterium capnotolerans TaxID=2759528 RepID=UPI001E4DBDF6|nr:hypothetical protein [Chryseobacterium capnotolerans]UHO36675.1 hypothetical protein H5J24_12545 [Chryseobacterium capnotolerans]
MKSIKNNKIYTRTLEKMMICALGISLLLYVISCSSGSRDKDKEDFDTALINKSSDLQLSGEYEALIKLNVEYLRKAAKMGYNEGIALCYLNMAEVNISAGNYEKALFFSIRLKKI